MTTPSLQMIEDIFQYLLAGGILAGVWKASAILADIRGMLKSGETWMNEHKPIIAQTHDAVKAHQRGGFEIGQRVSAIDGKPAPPEFDRPYLQ